MKKDIGEKTLGQLKASNRSSIIVILILSITNIVMVLLIGFMFTTRTTVVQMPENISGRNYILDDNEANKDFFIDHAVDILNLIYNVTPINVDEKFDKLIKQIPVEYQKDIQTYLNKSAKRIKEQQLTQIWSSTGHYEYIASEKAVIAEGENKVFVGDRLVASKIQKLKVTFVYKNGHISPIAIKEIVKDEE